MNLAVLERPMRHRRVVPDPHSVEVRLPLRTELFLIAHDDDTGRQHLSQRSLCQGLAGAVLLELWLTNQITIGRSYLAREGVYAPDPGRICIVDPTLYGDPLTDAAMTLILRTGGAMYVSQFIRQFGTPDLYERVRGDMLATGVLHRGTRRAFRLFRKLTYLPTEPAYPVRARSLVRKLGTRSGHDPLNPVTPQTVALAGLVTALGLTRHLLHADPVRLHARLMDLIGNMPDNTIRDVAAAINPAHKRR